MRPRKVIGWTEADEKLLVSLRSAGIEFSKIQQVLSRHRSIGALQSRLWKLTYPERHIEKVARQAIYNKTRHDRERYGTEYGYHAQEWPEEARFTSMVMK